ncbi:probable acyl-activating enzyme 17, peroxisomal [Phalaenopsis equestris]|uniref:probable acyl-activating enzyme 17, peroxisomal n=1 Tax=Phalaenopsis equestris TaxID=78828 RepID=UPI0009E36B31|nr:probable acyl-activating enzyme 17, peroxisomal [Phalaenopsis equestris]
MAVRSLDELTVEHISSTGLPANEAERLHGELTAILRKQGNSGPAAWKFLSRRLLNPDLPFAFHQMIYYGCYKEFGSATPPAWIPELEDAVLTNIGRVLERHGKAFLGPRYRDPISNFSDFQEFSVTNPEVYWKLVFEEMRIFFYEPPSQIVREHTSYPGGQWLPGATINAAANCLHADDKKSPNDVVIIWKDEESDSLPVQKMTLKELQAEVWMVAHAIDALGLTKGSSIAIDMPMTVTAVIIYLAIVLAGYVVVSIADSFAPTEIATRLIISKAQAIFTQDYIIRAKKELPLYRKVVDANAPLAVVIATSGSTIKSSLRAGDVSWHDFLGRAKHCKDNEYSAVKKSIDAFSNILFSSGTTGEPKAIPWTHATPLKAAADAWSHMDIRKGDVVAWPTNLGWMMGPWLVYATLLNGSAMALYNGSPLGLGFAKFVQDAKVTMLGVVPSIARSWKNTNCTADLDWSNIRCFSSSGEASSVDEYLWLMGRAHYKPVIEYCGGTEIGGGFATGSLLQPQALAAFSTPAMGCTLFILDSNGIPLPQSKPGIGELALHPKMFGASTTLLNADHYAVYFEGMPLWRETPLRRHGDEFERTVNGYYRAHGRADDTMNLGGIKVSSVEIERICNGVDEEILETAAIGVPPAGGGPEQLFVAVVFKVENSSEESLDRLKVSFNSALQKKLNPLFRVSVVVAVPSLPRTASNKVMRRVLRQQFLKRSKF